MVALVYVLTVLGVAILFGFTDYFGHFIGGLSSAKRYQILSFSSGVMIGLIFLVLLPDLIENSTSIIFLFLFLGFIIMHLAEKYIYQHVTDKQQLLDELDILHIIGFGLDNFLIGIILATTLAIEGEILVGIFLVVPLFFQMLVSSFSLVFISQEGKNKVIKIVLSLLPLLGAGIGLLLELDEALTNYLNGIVIGILFYMVNRDVLPQDKHGHLPYFFAGVIISILVWVFQL